MTTGSGSGGAPQARPAVRVCSVGRRLLSEVQRWDADRAEPLWSTVWPKRCTAPVGEDGRLGPDTCRASTAWPASPGRLAPASGGPVTAP
jgi:hypothetical protein